MASEPVNGEGIDKASVKPSFIVYTRKGKGKRKSQFALKFSGATPEEETLENEKENNHVILPESLAPAIPVVDNSVEEAALEPDSQEDSQEDVGDTIAKNSSEALSENLPGDDSDKVIDKPLVDTFSQRESQDDVSLAATDKSVVQPVPVPLGQDDVSATVGDKSVEVPSQSRKTQDDVSLLATDKSVVQPVPAPLDQDDVIAIVGVKSVEVPSQSHKTQDNVSTVVVDENSIKDPPKSLPQEEVTTDVVDKNLIEAPSQDLSVEDVTTVVVDKNPIEVSSSEEDVHVVDEDNQIKEAHSGNLVEKSDAIDAQQPAGLSSDSAPNIHATAASECVLMEEDEDGRVRIRVASKSKQQKEEIKKKLEDQLNVVKGLVKKIEDKEGEIGAYNDSRVLVNAGMNNGGGRILSGYGSAGLPREIIRVPRPLNQLSVSVLENTLGVNEYAEKEKRTPKANQFYRTSDFVLGDKLPPAESNKKSKSSAKKQGEVGFGFGPGSKVFKNCSALLERLIKHKHGWVFKAPVDVKGLGLHDYFTIIEHPMDLGTVKSTLTNNLYKSPREFAEDVRLTFHNAMTYNPEGQDVHVMAVILLQLFEERWAVIEADYNRELRFVSGYGMNLSTPTMRSRLGPTMPPPPISVRNTVDRSDWSSRHADLQHPKPTTAPGRIPSSTTPSGRTPALKKPKANEPNKRDMTYEEKQKLSGHLQNLPPDKLDAIVQIVNRRNTDVKLQDEEIEVDIDSVDPETLWELDRFVTNYKKGLSKKKRKAELAIQAREEAERNSQQQLAPAPEAREFSREGGNTSKKTLRIPSQADQQNNETSSSSSSSGSSSSSSDSDSDSSSSSSESD